MQEQESKNIDLLKKRARAKYFTNSYLHRLIGLESGLQKSYLQTLACASILTQDGDKITGHYCNQRWCTVCNRIRIAKMIEGYGAELHQLNEPYFVTLTVPNCTKDALKATIEQMNASFQKIVDVLKKRKIKLRALRKLEVTYNADTNTYHPHFHIILEFFEGFVELTIKRQSVLCQIGFIGRAPSGYL